MVAVWNFTSFLAVLHYFCSLLDNHASVKTGNVSINHTRMTTVKTGNVSINHTRMTTVKTGNVSINHTRMTTVKTGNVSIKHTRMTTSLTSFLRGCYLPSLPRPMLPLVGGFAISSDGYFFRVVRLYFNTL